MTVTLEDVAILVGLPVNGEPITYNPDKNWDRWVNDCLGVPPMRKHVPTNLPYPLDGCVINLGLFRLVRAKTLLGAMFELTYWFYLGRCYLPIFQFLVCTCH